MSARDAASTPGRDAAAARAAPLSTILMPSRPRAGRLARRIAHEADAARQA